MIGASKKIGEASARQLMRLMHGVSVRVGQGGGAGSASKVYVGNLPSDVTKEVPWKSLPFVFVPSQNFCLPEVLQRVFSTYGQRA